MALLEGAQTRTDSGQEEEEEREEEEECGSSTK
jgi:hypothetical protein